MAEISDPKSEADLVNHVEKLYFAIQRNLTIEAKNIIWQCLNTAKEYYAATSHKEAWVRMLNAMEDVIDDFENQFPERAELKLHALQKNLEELKKKETNSKR